MNEAARPGNANLPIGETAKGIKENANREIGVPRGGPGWHSRGYLPHFDGAEATQHVTFHLADSLPKEVLERMEAELKCLPVKKRDVERRKRIEAWIDSGHGSCVLRDPAVAFMVQNALLFFDGQRYRLFAWVVMPNHVHVLFQPLNGWTVAKIVASWKKFTARRISEHRRGAAAGNANREIGGREENANREIGVPGSYPVWHREYWDRYMRDENHFLQAMDYLHRNPVKAGLVARPEDWRWSSAHSGNADLPIGLAPDANSPAGPAPDANQEIGVPRRQP